MRGEEGGWFLNGPEPSQSSRGDETLTRKGEEDVRGGGGGWRVSCEAWVSCRGPQATGRPGRQAGHAWPACLSLSGQFSGAKCLPVPKGLPKMPAKGQRGQDLFPLKPTTSQISVHGPAGKARG